MTRTEELLRATFTEEVSAALIEKLRQAYEVNYPYYDPEVGHDGIVYGLMVYKSKVHFICQLAKDFDKIEILSRYPFFTFRVGRYRVATYCAGNSADADINSSFPHNRTRAPMITEQYQLQMRLPFEETLVFDDSNCLEVMLADIGNPNEGLCKAFLGIPIETAPDGRITKWGTTVELWSGDTPLSARTNDSRGNRPLAVDVAPPEIRLKDKGKRDKKKEKE